MLRLLAALGVLTEHSPCTFGLTAVGERLRGDVPASMRSWALLADAIGFCGHEPVVEAVRSGRTGVEIAYGVTTMERVRADARRAARFDEAMSERTAAFAPSVAATCDFSGMRVVADIGGGQATLLAAILSRHEHLRGVLFDVPDAARRAVRVLHDWDDDRAAAILRECGRAMRPGGRVLITERLIPADPRDAVPVLLSDLNMLLLSGGRERTNAEYGALLAAAGLRAGRIQPVAAPYGVIEGLAA